MVPMGHIPGSHATQQGTSGLQAVPLVQTVHPVAPGTHVQMP
jgi:hypothetical protein